MQKAKVIIRFLQKKDLPEAVTIHEKTIQSAGSAIGESYLRRIYQSVYNDPQLGFGMVAEDQKTNSTVGVILVTYDIKRFGDIRQMLSDPKIIWHIGLGIITGRIKLLQLILHWKFQHTVQDLYQKPYISIQALCVVRHMQRFGIGGALVAAVIKEAKEKNISRIFVDTLKTNVTARKFYSSVGFMERAKASDSILFVLRLKR